MIGKITLASTKQILVMSVAWALVCLGIDVTFNRQLWAKSDTAPPSSVPLSLHFHHLRAPGATADCEPLPDVGVVRVGGRLKWLDSLTTDATGSTVIFHVRYQK